MEGTAVASLIIAWGCTQSPSSSRGANPSIFLFLLCLEQLTNYLNKHEHQHLSANFFHNRQAEKSHCWAYKEIILFCRVALHFPHCLENQSVSHHTQQNQSIWTSPTETNECLWKYSFNFGKRENFAWHPVQTKWRMRKDVWSCLCFQTPLNHCFKASNVAL